MTNVAPLPTDRHTLRTATTVRPELVDEATYGHHRSTVVKGERVWWFANERGRGLFVATLSSGETFSKRLTFSTRDRESGEYTASFDGKYHATGASLDVAVVNLGDFLSAEHPQVWADAENYVARYFSGKT